MNTINQTVRFLVTFCTVLFITISCQKELPSTTSTMKTSRNGNVFARADATQCGWTNSRQVLEEHGANAETVQLADFENESYWIIEEQGIKIIHIPLRTENPSFDYILLGFNGNNELLSGKVIHIQHNGDLEKIDEDQICGVMTTKDLDGSNSSNITLLGGYNIETGELFAMARACTSPRPLVTVGLWFNLLAQLGLNSGIWYGTSGPNWGLLNSGTTGGGGAGQELPGDPTDPCIGGTPITEESFISEDNIDGGDKICRKSFNFKKVIELTNGVGGWQVAAVKNIHMNIVNTQTGEYVLLQLPTIYFGLPVITSANEFYSTSMAAAVAQEAVERAEFDVMTYYHSNPGSGINIAGMTTYYRQRINYYMSLSFGSATLTPPNGIGSITPTLATYSILGFCF